MNEAFSDDQVAAIVVSDTIVVMLLTRDRFADFVTGSVGDPRDGPTTITCLSAESPAEVDRLVGTAMAAGGSAWLPKMQEGPMYGHSFADPDGHVWEVLHMDLGGAEPNGRSGLTARQPRSVASASRTWCSNSAAGCVNVSAPY